MKRAPLAMLAAAATIACGPGSHPAPAPGPRPAPEPGQPLPAPAPTPPAPLSEPGLRLPRDLAIESYDLALTLDPARSTMTGVVEIEGQVVKATDVIWLHAEDLTIRSAVATVDGRDIDLVADLTIARGRLALRAPAPLPIGGITVLIAYEAKLAETETAGTFRQQAAGDWYAFTQHEAISARRSFPCLDEPDLKVPWTIHLQVPASSIAVSNAPVQADTVDGGVRHVSFSPTEAIPSYLVAYAVGPFDIVDAGKSASGVPHRILTLKGRAAEAAIAAELMPRVTTELERWFGMPHPFPKLDSISIPATTGFGAMENPGLITYRESLLLLPADASPQRRSRLMGLAAHEIAHQWFGNLVTPMWWDDLWLNESFASWLPEKVVIALEPSWRRPEDAMDGREDALANDSLASARRIRQPIESEGDIVNAFDRITYAKGATVLRLFEQRLGPERFQAGVRAYLHAHARKAATAADFLAAIDAAAPGAGAGAAMATFLDQAGAPRLTAAVTCPEDGQAGVTLTQARFVPPGAGTVPATTWRLPVCLKSGTAAGATETCVDLSAGTLFVPLTSCPTWVWPNAGGIGYWRSSLDPAMWSALRTQAWKHLGAAERVAVAHDLFAAVSAGEVGIAVALDLLPLLVAEGNRTALAAAGGFIERIDPWIPSTLRPRYAAWVRKHLGARAARLGWLPAHGDDLQRDAIRGRIVGVVATLGEEPKLARAAVKLARAWRALPEAGRGDVLVAAVRAQPALADAFLADFRAETSRSVRGDLARALAAVRDPARLEAAMAMALDRSLDIRDTLAVVTGATGHDDTRPTADAFIVAHLDELIARLPGDTASALVGPLASGCAPISSERRALIEAKLGALRGARRRIDQAFERVDQCAARRRAIELDLAQWFNKPR